MFFLASKLFWFFAAPLHLALIGLGVGLAARHWPFGMPLAVASLALLAVMTFSPLGALLLRPLENRFPRGEIVRPPKGIIVLGGSIDERNSRTRGVIALNDAGERLTEAAALSRLYPDALLVFTGGSVSLIDDSIKEAEYVHQFWLSLGVPENRMVFENQSRNTYENAVFTRDLVHPGAAEDWLLITSAFHMPRSMGIFRALGMNPQPWPTDYRTFGDSQDWRLPIDGPLAIRTVEIALKEYIGLIAYRLDGKTNALFPAP
jgi:uncharacterized SAM-binding protein YcdF (DUF218 family)